jgi:hypothetical protein
MTFTVVKHNLVTVDVQAIHNGILVLVAGTLKTDDDPPVMFSQVEFGIC